MYFITIVVQNHICHLGRIGNKKMILFEFGKIAEQEWHRSFELREELFLHEFIIMPNHIHALIGIKHPIDREINEIHTPGAHDMDGGPGDHVDTHGRAYQNPETEDDSDMPGRTNQNNDSNTHGHANQNDDVNTHGRTNQNNDSNTHGRAYKNDDVNTHGRAYRHAPDTDAPDAQAGPYSKERKFIRKPKSISSFIAGFKSAVIVRIDDYIDDHKLEIPKFNRKNKFWQDNYHDRIIRTDAEYWNVKRYIVRNPEDWNEDDYFKR